VSLQANLPWLCFTVSHAFLSFSLLFFVSFFFFDFSLHWFHNLVFETAIMNGETNLTAAAAPAPAPASTTQTEPNAIIAPRPSKRARIDSEQEILRAASALSTVASSSVAVSASTSSNSHENNINGLDEDMKTATAASPRDSVHNDMQPKLRDITGTITKLDENIWYEILRWLDMYTMLTTVSVVCKQWNLAALSPSAWEVVDFSSVRFQYATDDEVKLSTRWSQAKELHMYECFDLRDHGITTVFSRCTNIQVLDLSGCNMLGSAALTHLGKLHDLVALNLTGCQQANDAVITNVAHGCKKLLDLNLWGCSQITDVGIIAIGNCCRHLRRLNLTWLSKLSNGLSSVGEHCRDLRELTLTWCERLKDSAIAKLQQNTELRYLDADGCGRLSDTALRSLATHCPKLRVLRCRFCTRMTVEGLLYLLNAVQTMEWVDCRYCDAIHPSVGDRIRTRFPERSLCVKTGMNVTDSDDSSDGLDLTQVAQLVSHGAVPSKKRVPMRREAQTLLEHAYGPVLVNSESDNEPVRAFFISPGSAILRKSLGYADWQDM
jgi:F-box domain